MAGFGVAVGTGAGVCGAGVGACVGRAVGAGVAIGRGESATASGLGLALGTAGGDGRGLGWKTGGLLGAGIGATVACGRGGGLGVPRGVSFASSWRAGGCFCAGGICCADVCSGAMRGAVRAGARAATVGIGAGALVIVTTVPPMVLSAGLCVDVDDGSEKSNAAISRWNTIDASPLIARRRLPCSSRGSRANIALTCAPANAGACNRRRAHAASMEQILQKRTKIVATIGPASREPAMMRSLFLCGTNVIRLNFSHGTPDEHAEVIKNARAIASELGIYVAVLQDLPGPKVRTGKLHDGVPSVRLERGARFVLTTDDDAGTAERVSVSYRDLPHDVTVGNRLYLQDGAITLRIIGKTAHEIETTVEFGGDLRSTQGINYPDGSLNVAAVTDRDLEYCEFGLLHNVDFIAVSFVRSAADIHRIKHFIAERGKNTPVLAKIEKHEALEELDDIIAASDGIMVARGDLGIEIPLERVPLVQKQLIAKCNRASKPVVTATQMLESMISSARPTRAETTDVANAILDGTDAVMLSGETARGMYPAQAVRTMAEIAREIEKYYPHAQLRDRRLDGIEPTVATSIAEAATRSSDELGIPYIVTGTTTGNTALHIAAFRPRARIIALTPDPAVARRLSLLWGTESMLIDHYASIDVLLYMTEQRMLQAGLVRTGERIAFTTGMPVGTGGTNVLKIHQIP